MRFVLLTGRAGYVGSHPYLALHAAGLTPVILADFSNSSPVVCERGSVADTARVQALIHFAVMCTDAWRWQSRNPDGYR
jgi:UDP-glucose 4-epimerase